MKKTFFVLSSFFVLSLTLTLGCAKLKRSGTLDESSLDATLKLGSPAAAPEVNPGEPQPEFDQQPLQAQNL